MTKLSVNINKFALVRNSRGSDTPNIANIARRILGCGAHGITLHPRPDQRHATYADAAALREVVRSFSSAELNIEGNPIGGFMEVVEKVTPQQCTLVPDEPGQLTSDHGWNMQRDAALVQPIVQRLRASGIRTSFFIDAENLAGIEIARQIGADRIELYTEPYAKAFRDGAQELVTRRFAIAAKRARDIGLGVNAGHDLNLGNLGYFLHNVAGVAEVSIGHALVVEAWDFGLEETIRRYLRVLTEAAAGVSFA
jgi:pyridoxine 5-phosphate synthase